MCHLLGFSRKKIVPVPSLLRFFRSWPPGFPVKFTVTTLEFSFFFLHWPSWKSIFPQFLVYPLEFHRLLLYPLELPIYILNRVTISFRKSSVNDSLERYWANCHFMTKIRYQIIRVYAKALSWVFGKIFKCKRKYCWFLHYL